MLIDSSIRNRSQNVDLSQIPSLMYNSIQQPGVGYMHCLTSIELHSLYSYITLIIIMWKAKIFKNEIFIWKNYVYLQALTGILYKVQNKFKAQESIIIQKV